MKKIKDSVNMEVELDEFGYYYEDVMGVYVVHYDEYSIFIEALENGQKGKIFTEDEYYDNCDDALEELIDDLIKAGLVETIPND